MLTFNCCFYKVRERGFQGILLHYRFCTLCVKTIKIIFFFSLVYARLIIAYIFSEANKWNKQNIVSSMVAQRKQRKNVGILYHDMKVLDCNKVIQKRILSTFFPLFFSVVIFIFPEMIIFIFINAFFDWLVLDRKSCFDASLLL